MKNILIHCCFLILAISTQAQPTTPNQKTIMPERPLSKEKANANSREPADKRTNEHVPLKSNAGISNTTSSPATVSPHERIIWEGTSGSDFDELVPDTVLPAKVKTTFASDYPGVIPRWNKYRGEWTATFRNGAYQSTAIYHANGSRRDTRSSLEYGQIPAGLITIVTTKYPGSEIKVAVRIEAPATKKYIYRIKTVTEGNTRFLFFDEDGNEVSYLY